MNHRKDRSLDELARSGNVAQFVSFAPAGEGEIEQTYSRVVGFEANHRFTDVAEAVWSLLCASADRSVNVRSYAPDSPRSREFVYGLTTAPDAIAAIRRLSADGLHVIVNETVDIEDGGVSGVVQNGIIEFAPDDTPRCVEKPGVASLPLDWGLRMLEIVYGFAPDLGGARGRVEFSIHPRPRGWRSTHTLLWEQEDVAAETGTPSLAWPNRFSRHVGDKAYGLLMAHLSGLSVPSTVAICRRIAPFAFGVPTGSREVWIRTCPKEQEPGLFTTAKGWIDPFALLAREDPSSERIASVLSQAAVPARFSGASLTDAEDHLVTEGVEGEGDLFMLGRRPKEDLPTKVLDDIASTCGAAQKLLGPIRTEWVHDGEKTWIVQLHRGASPSTATILVPGERDEWVDFEIVRGLEALRTFAACLDGATGVRLVGDVGMTSHVADLMRKTGVPTRVASAAA